MRRGEGQDQRQGGEAESTAGASRGEGGKSARLAREFLTERSQLDAIVRHIPAGLALSVAPSGRIVLTNPALERILGHPPISSPNLSAYAQWHGYHPDGRPLAAEDWPLAQAIRYGRPVHGVECLYRRGDGTMVWLRTDAEPLRDPAGEVVGAVAMVVDITQEKRAEEEHRFLAEVGAILGSSLDLKGMLDGFVEVAVARQADLCGVYLIDEESGEFRRQSIAARSPELAELVSRIRPHMPVLRTPLLREVAFSGEPYLLEQDTDEWMRKVAANEEHLELMRELRLHSVLYLPLLARGHTFGALVCARAEPGSRYTEHDVALAEEVSRRLALAIDNIRLYDSALAGSRAKSEFLAVMSHELRTPLNAIVGYSDLLLLGLPEALSKEAGQAVERILGSADHLRELIDEILSFSRMEAGSEVVHTEQADLGYLVRSVAAGAEALAREKGLDFDLQLPAPSVAILTDQDKLRQILRNLLSNAIKFTTQGEVGLEVGLAGSDLIVHVRDTGPGIAPELRERIFEPFWQLEQGRTRRVSGTGLGLGVSRLLARMLGGDITVESEPGKGSTFTVRVPAGLEDESIDE